MTGARAPGAAPRGGEQAAACLVKEIPRSRGRNGHRSAYEMQTLCHHETMKDQENDERERAPKHETKSVDPVLTYLYCLPPAIHYRLETRCRPRISRANLILARLRLISRLPPRPAELTFLPFQFYDLCEEICRFQSGWAWAEARAACCSR